MKGKVSAGGLRVMLERELAEEGRVLAEREMDLEYGVLGARVMVSEKFDVLEGRALVRMVKVRWQEERGSMAEREQPVPAGPGAGETVTSKGEVVARAPMLAVEPPVFVATMVKDGVVELRETRPKSTEAADRERAGALETVRETFLVVEEVDPERVSDPE